MRIERIVIENINSLTGRFEIDLTDGKYAEGLFAIVGPSGAGKTTVLDSVCLALYGETPRIGTISETQDEIMNKNCGSCLAEVVFVSRGKRYKASFSHQRAKGANPYRQVKREITELGADGTGTIIASMIKEANEKIEEITGLSYSQFTRSIMLAQFRFAEFLKADSNERAAILEQISDMDIYRNISAAVYERAKREKTGLDDIKTRMQLLRVLDEGQIKELEEEQGKLAYSIALHKALRERFMSCRNTAEKLQNYRKELEGYQKNQPALEQDLNDKAKQLGQAEQSEKQTKAALAELQKTLKTVRELDSNIKIQRTDAARIKKEIDEGTGRISAQKKTIMGIFLKYIPDADNERLRSLYFGDAEAALRTGARAELGEAAEKEHALRQDISSVLQEKDEKYWHGRVDALRIAIPLLEAREEKAKAETELARQKKQYKELLQQKDELESQVKIIEEKLVYAKLEERFGEERRKLEDGKPCPLCGATEHPATEKAFDSTFLDEALKQKEGTAKNIEINLRECAGAEKNIADLEKIIADKAQIIKQKENELTSAGLGQITGKVEEAKKHLDEAEKILRDYTLLLGKLNTATNNVVSMTARLGEIDKDITAVQSSKHFIADLEKQNAERENAWQEAEKAAKQKETERFKLFGEKNTDLEESRAQELSDKAQQQKEVCHMAKESAERNFEQNKKDIGRTQEYIKSDNLKLDVQYNDARISVHEVIEAGYPENEGIAALAENFAAAAEEFKEALPESPHKFDRVIDVLNELSSEETSGQGAVKQQLADNAKNINEMGQLKTNANRQEQICARWDRLNALIGSADGIKFSRMAQGYTFEALLKYANICLKRMTDRYVLVRDTSNAAKPLELCVMDNYQAGDRRPVSNLSGGESFLVSLALALGMSEMSSGKTQIDSLFIDEGFASLDEDYLEAALQTLSSLGNREGKLVGVISHVGALKERIDAQIEVKKLSGGRSTLTGPGVRAAGE